MGRRFTLAMCACSLVGCAHAQPAQSWAGLIHRLSPGAPVAVTDAGGNEVRGSVTTASETTLTLKVGKALRPFAPDDIRQVRLDGDPLWNGLAIGAGVGVLAAVMPDYKCGGYPRRCDDAQLPLRVGTVAIATALGAWIDARHRDQTVLYRSPDRMSVHVVPVLTSTRQSLSITIGFPAVRQSRLQRDGHAQIGRRD